MKWLGGWLSGGLEIMDLPKVVIKECKPYLLQTEKQVTLYKAVKDNDIIEDDLYKNRYPSSWTYSFEVAANFNEGLDLGIIKLMASNSMVLIDTTNIDSNFIESKFSGFPEEEEVIILPGEYRIEYVDV